MIETISVQLPRSLLRRVDALAPRRDDFFRDAIEEKIAQTTRPARRRSRPQPSLPDALAEYRLTPREVQRAHAKTLRAVDRERRAGRLKPWSKP
jgi:hypothetical protein